MLYYGDNKLIHAFMKDFIASFRCMQIFFYVNKHEEIIEYTVYRQLKPN